jgi:hypothetical protein
VNEIDKAVDELFPERAAHRAKIEEDARARGDWNELLGLADSQNRAERLVEACRAVSDDEARHLLTEWFNICDALEPWRDELREQFERVGYVTDDPAIVLDLPVKVYRGAWEDDDAWLALSWTKSRAIAERFARGLTGMRSRFVLGTYREGVTPYIFEADCTEAYGYLTGRDEHEVIAKALVNVRPIAALVPAGEAS